MFSGYAALTIETLRENRLAAERNRRERDAAELRMLMTEAVLAAAAATIEPAHVD